MLSDSKTEAQRLVPDDTGGMLINVLPVWCTIISLDYMLLPFVNI